MMIVVMKTPNEYMIGYITATRFVHQHMKGCGWTRTKGAVKSILHNTRYMPTDDWDRGRIDALLDSVN